MYSKMIHITFILPTPEENASPPLKLYDNKIYNIGYIGKRVNTGDTVNNTKNAITLSNRL